MRPASRDREHAFSSLFRFWAIYSPIGAKKRVPGRILKNGLVQSMPESLKNAYTEGV